MQLLPAELIEQILAFVVLSDVTGIDPVPLLRVVPGLSSLRRIVFAHSLHKRFWEALDSGHIDVLDELIERRRSLPLSDLTEASFYFACLCVTGRVDLLDELLKSDRKVPSNYLYMDLASAHGQIGVLQWLFDHGLDNDYTEAAINRPAKAGLIDVLDWWEAAELELDFSDDLFEDAIKRDDPDVLKWLIRHCGSCESIDFPACLHGDFKTYLVNLAFQHGSAKVLDECGDWLPWEMELETADWTEHIKSAIELEQVALIDWIRQNVEEDLLDYVSEPKYESELYGVDSIQSNADTGEYDFDYDHFADNDWGRSGFWAYMIGYASKWNRISVLDWFLANLLPAWM
ncbi:hypothetical protein H9P43_009088, partial [Blastocladiella emersonii ATCC 22665]